MKTIYETIDDESYMEIAISDRDLEILCEGDILQKRIFTDEGYVNFSIRKYTSREEREYAVKRREK